MRFMTLMLLAMLAGCVIHVDPDYDSGPDHVESRTTTINGPITQLVTDIDSGSLFVQGGFLTHATVDADLFYDFRAEPDLDVYSVGDTLYIDLHCPTVADECRGDIFVQLPFDAFLDTTVGVGNITVADSMGDWIGSVGVGNIHGDNLTGFWVDVLVDTGNIDLHFDLEPDSVSSYVRIGDSSVTVPAGVYAINTSAHVGSVWLNGVIADPRASRELNVTTSTGNIIINGF